MLQAPDPDREGERPISTLVVSLVEGLGPLRARVPMALSRGIEAVEALSDQIVAETGGERLQSPVEGWLAVWPSTPAAVRYAMRLQEALLELDWPPTLLLRPEAGEERDEEGRPLFRGLRIRQGVHLGRLEFHPGRIGQQAVAGPAVHQVTRLAHAAHGGQVLLSEAAWRRMRGALGVSTVLRDLGSHDLDGVPGVGRLFQVLPVRLDRRRFDPPRTRNALRTNVLERSRWFVGRSGDLAALAELDAFGVRLVTVVGEPGAGKSRLVRQHALVHGARYRPDGGAWLAQVESREPGELIRSVGHALGLPLVFGRQSRDLTEQIGHALAARGRTLVVVDGLLGPDVPEILETWLRMAPEARFVLAASRRLGLKGEVAYELGPFPPIDGDAPHSADATRMFLSRARELGPDPNIDVDEVVGLVEQLGRNPLSIEIAAGLVDRLAVPEIRARLQDRDEGPLLAIADIAWEAATPAERALLEACAVFAGVFDPLLLEALVEPSVVPDLPATLSSLRTRGLVQSADDARAPAVSRFVMPPRVREYVRRQIELRRLESLRAVMADAILARCAPWPERAWGTEGPETVARIALEWANLVDVVRWGLDPAHTDPAPLDRALCALLVLEPVVTLRGPATVFLPLLERALERVDKVLGADPLLQVRVLAARGDALRHAGQARQARADLERGRAIAERWADIEGVARCQASLGFVLWQSGRAEEALALLRAAREGFREVGPRRREGVAAGALGVLLLDGGHVEEAEVGLLDAIGIFREIGARHLEGMYLGNLALLYRRTGRLGETWDLHREAMRIHRETGDRRLEGLALLNLGLLQFHVGNLDEAERNYQQGLALAQQVGDRSCVARCRGNLGLLHLERGALQEARAELLAAMALNRDLGDRRGEGHDAGYLAIVQQGEGQAQAAREGWKRALQLLEQVGDRRGQALFLAWWAAFEARQGRLDLADEPLARARLLADGVGDRFLAATVDVLGAAVDRARGLEVTDDRLKQAEALQREDADLRLALRATFRG